MSNPREIRVLAIGASAGGVTAVRRLLARLDVHFRAPILVVQHLPATARLDVSLIYSNAQGREVVEAQDKILVERGFVYMACPGYHLLIEKDGSLALSVDEPIHYSRPSIDALFESVARAYGPLAVGVLLTGANSDGAAGLRRIQQAGGFTVVQDPSEADSDTMPKAALAMMKPDRVATIDAIADGLNEMASTGLWPLPEPEKADHAGAQTQGSSSGADT